MSQRDDEHRRSGPNTRTKVHDWNAGESLSVTVLQAVADLLDKEPGEIQPINDVVVDRHCSAGRNRENGEPQMTRFCR